MRCHLALRSAGDVTGPRATLSSCILLQRTSCLFHCCGSGPSLTESTDVGYVDWPLLCEFKGDCYCSCLMVLVTFFLQEEGDVTHSISVHPGTPARSLPRHSDFLSAAVWHSAAQCRQSASASSTWRLFPRGGASAGGPTMGALCASAASYACLHVHYIAQACAGCDGCLSFCVSAALGLHQSGTPLAAGVLRLRCNMLRSLSQHTH